MSNFICHFLLIKRARDPKSDWVSVLIRNQAEKAKTKLEMAESASKLMSFFTMVAAVAVYIVDKAFLL